MFCEEENAFNMFLKPQGYTQQVLVKKNTERKNNLIYLKEIPQGYFDLFIVL